MRGDIKVIAVTTNKKKNIFIMANAAFKQILEELKDIKSSNAASKKDFRDLKEFNVQILKDFKDFKNIQEQQLKEVKNILLKTKEENVELKNTVLNLKAKCVNLELEVSHLNAGFNKLHQEKLCNNFIIPGIPFVRGENLSQLIIKMGSLLKVDLKPTDFLVRRLKTKENISSSLLVKSCKKMLLFQSRKCNGILLSQLGFGAANKKEIYFYHHLTSCNQDLINLTKTELKTTGLVKYIWFQNDKILVRRSSKSSIFAVSVKDDISKLVIKFKEESCEEVIDLVSDDI